MSDKTTYCPAADIRQAISDPILAELHGYWDRLRDGDTVPLRRDLDPVDIPRLLPYVALVECHDHGERIRFRLVGTDVAFGSDPTGRYLHEAAPEGAYRDHITELYRLGARSEEGLYSEFTYGYTNDSGPKLIKRLFLPLIGPAEIPEMMLIGQVRDKSVHVLRSAWQAEPGRIEQKRLIRLSRQRAASSQPRPAARSAGS